MPCLSAPRWVELCLDEYLRHGWAIWQMRWGDDGRPSVLVLRNDNFDTHAQGGDWWRERDADYKVVVRM